MYKLKERKGFTLAELLIVVAIIAVLTAVAIPVFTAQLEKSKEATDMANVRSAYAEVVTQYLTDSGSHTMSVTAQQGRSGWQNSENGKLITQVDGKESTITVDAKTKGNKYKVHISKSGTVSIED